MVEHDTWVPGTGRDVDDAGKEVVGVVRVGFVQRSIYSPVRILTSGPQRGKQSNLIGLLYDLAKWGG